uniref:F-box domain-containing protein n=1 Tax=Oryza brachyantha TaxID=4533 RepID=J3LNA0_ORYBR
MQSRHRVFAEDLLLPREEGEDHFDRVPDSLVLLIFNRLADARSLGRCSAVSKRFNALVPLVLKNFSSIRNLRMELPVSDVGTDDGVLLRWKAVFGSTLQSCVILGGTRVDRAAAVPAAAATAAGDHEASQGDDSGSIPESFYTNGGLKLRVVWTISSLIAAATRHYLLREIVKEHPTLETVALTDAHGQGTLSMGRDQIKEFRDKPLAAAAAANRTQVPACNMKLRYAPMLELSDGTRIQGATLVVIKPVGEAGGIGGGRKELDEFVADAFDGPYREAVSALSKRRTYLLEMNGF